MKSKILKCPQINPSDINDNYSEKNIQSTFDIQVNESFKSAKVKINVNAPLRAIEKSESDRDTQQIDEERKFVVQAAIVRIMKACKGMKHSLLVQEVIDQLKGRFQPEVSMIKVKQNRRILIELFICLFLAMHRYVNRKRIFGKR